MTILQHTLLPNYSVYDKDIGLYFNASEAVHLLNGVLHIPPYQKVSFDTYFNYFSVRKWVDFGQIDDLFIAGNLCGIAILEIIGIKYYGKSTKQTLLERVKIGIENEWSDFFEPIDEFENYDAVFIRVHTADRACEVGLLEYGTTNDIKRQAKLAVGILSDKDCRLLIKEIDVLKNNNGLDITATVIDDKNPEALIHFFKQTQYQDSTHLLVFSESTFIHTECIFRAVRFFELVFTERSDVVISGLPLSALNNNEYLCQNPLKSVIKGGSKLNNFDWHFCIFDKKIIRDFGLPLPLGITQSAKEYQERIYKEIVPINGVAYYQDLIPKVSVIDLEYYQFKDKIITELLQSKPRLGEIKKLVLDRFWYNIHTYHYVGARLNLCALDHIIGGSYKTNREDIEKLVNHLYINENRFTRNAVINDSSDRQHQNTVNDTIINRIKPYVGIKNTKILLVKERKIKDFIGQTKVLVADEFGNAEIARIRRRKAGELVSHATKSYYNFTKNYQKIRLDVLQYRNDKKRIFK